MQSDKIKSMTHELQKLPDFNTADELLAGIDSAHADLEQRTAKLLGSEDNPQSMLGIIRMLTDAMAENPESNFNIDLPTESLLTEEDKPKTEAERELAMEVNHQALMTIYEQAGVDFRLRQVEDTQIQDHVLRELIYFTQKGYVIIESQKFGYKVNPNTAVPVGLQVEAYTLRDGRPVGGVFLIPTAEARQST